ncbi:MAG TPA: basic amino acid ABC transporter substrate-binding protein [Actinomycetota bacterium]|jgi:ABC-type amino acid transport substrate-binding protein|nr:basic amino acid ABC transporter substrate-binding protein [Actinomycetota bacterium]
MRKRLAFLLLALVALLAAACGRETPETSGGDEQADLSETSIPACVTNQGTIAPAAADGGALELLTPGKLVVGSDTAFPPFESIENGKAVGFDVDLITEIGKRLNLQVDVQTAVFDTIFTSLAAKKFDAVISAVTIKEERKRTVDFTDPYFTSDLSLSVRAGDAGKFKGVDDLEGETIGVQAGTTSEDCAKSALKDKGKVADIRAYDTIPDAFTDLAAGRVAAVLIDLPTAKQITEERSGINVVQVIKTAEDYGIAVGKHAPNLRVAINDALKKIKDDGAYAKLFVKWFKTQPPE